MAGQRPKIVEIEASCLEELLARASQTLQPGDYQTIETLVNSYTSLIDLLQNKNTSLARLRKLLFGNSNEKLDDLLKNLVNNLDPDVTPDELLSPAAPPHNVTPDELLSPAAPPHDVTPDELLSPTSPPDDEPPDIAGDRPAEDTTVSTGELPAPGAGDNGKKKEKRARAKRRRQVHRFQASRGRS